MVFVDLLTSQLLSVGFSGVILAYVALCAYLSKNKDDRAANLKAGAIPLAVLGVYMLASGLYGQFTWPLPGSYNILFYDVYVMFGAVLVGLALAFHSAVKLKYMGLFGLMFGATAMLYGAFGYQASLSSAPSILFGLYALFGLGGILGYPLTLLLDVEKSKNRQGAWQLVPWLFALAVTLGGLLAITICLVAVPAHLASAP
ncbi:Uncharacterised protein [uncultured archaeon]|nr:Uncharacterised protein [uncultured archaeon]